MINNKEIVKLVNKILKDLEVLQEYFEYNQQRRITINEFKQDLNILFDLFPKDDEEDYRTNLIVLLLDVIDQIDIYNLKKEQLDLIIQITKSLSNPIDGDILDNYVQLAIENDILTIRLPDNLYTIQE